MNAIREYYNNLNVRERYMVMTMVIALGIFIPYQFILAPFIDGLNESETRVLKQRSQIQQMQQMALEMKQLNGGSSFSSRGGKQFMFGAINSAAKKFGLANAVNVKGESDERVRVNMENVSFDNVMKWLDELQHRQGMVIIQFNVERNETVGNVRANIVLEAP